MFKVVFCDEIPHGAKVFVSLKYNQRSSPEKCAPIDRHFESRHRGSALPAYFFTNVAVDGRSPVSRIFDCETMEYIPGNSVCDSY
jgi:hypothetical protein